MGSMDPLMLTMALGALAAMLLGLVGLIIVIRGMMLGRDGGPDPIHQRLRILTETQKLSNVGSSQFFLNIDHHQQTVIAVCNRHVDFHLTPPAKY